MVRYLWIGILSLLSATRGLAQSCAASNARPIDADVGFVVYWEIIEVSWAAIAAVRKRNLVHPFLNKRDLVCISGEECLSFKGDPFCDNPSTHTFHTADGTTGNFLTGDYTLADGRQGNMYHGPYPTNTVVAAASTQAESAPMATTSSAPLTSSSSAGKPVRSSDGLFTTSSQPVMIISQGGTSAVSIATVIPTSSSSTVLKSDGSWKEVSFQLLGSMSIITSLSFLLCL